MKNFFLPAAILALIVSLSACSSKSSFESDVKKMGNYRCKMQQLKAKDPSDEKAKKEVEDLKKEMDEYGEKMGKKYADKKNDKEMDEKAGKIMDEIMNNCK